MNNPKKILIFSVTYYPSLVGGDVVAVKEITNRLGTGDFEFHLITLRFDKKLPKEEKIGNIFVHRLGFVGEVKEALDSWKFPLHYNKYIYPFIGVWRGLQLSKKHNFSIVFAIMANYAGFAALFFKILRPEVRFILNLQEGDPFEHYKKRVGILHPLHKLIFKKADSITAISNFLALWGKKMGFKGEPIIVPNGVDVGKFEVRGTSEELRERKEVRERLGLKEGDILLITTSRLVTKNGVGDVIKALPKLDKNIKFVIFGEGYLKEHLTILVRSLKLEDRVVFGGFLDHKDMPKFLKASDIFIRASLSEGFGNSFIEAMACRIPVIATPVGGIPDFLFDPTSLDLNGASVQTGYYCEPENPESVAKTVQRVILDSNKDRVVENAYRMVVEKYDWNLISRQMREIFNQKL